MTTTAQLDLIAELATALADPYQHTEVIWTRTKHRHKKMSHAHRVVMPGLMAQLEERFEPGAAPDDAFSSASVYGPRPPVAVDCLSAHTQVTIAVARWLWLLQVDQRATVQANLHALIGAAPKLDEDQADALIANLTSWVRQAKILTGWSTPAYRPRAACPVDGCGRVGQLRVNLAAHTAVCLACGATWDPETVGLLADHIRLITELASAA